MCGGLRALRMPLAAAALQVPLDPAFCAGFGSTLSYESLPGSPLTARQTPMHDFYSVRAANQQETHTVHGQPRWHPQFAPHCNQHWIASRNLSEFKLTCDQLSGNPRRRDDLEFVAKMVDKGAIDRLQHVASTPFKRLTYTEAIEILEGVVRDGKKKFEFPVSG